ncbi:uncharacterized protein TRAVEDRAFT_30014, partial [Trametes versicolor FP-101664 SS1]|uniref:uncharacterized protein n=1 Tax=Trametes versicolor (strain FP-101664) TaxID=717944 RepID=UPI0004623FAE
MVIIIICAHMRRRRRGSSEFDYGFMGFQDPPLAGTSYTGPSSLADMVQRGDHCLASTPEMTPYTPSASP